MSSVHRQMGDIVNQSTCLAEAGRKPDGRPHVAVRARHLVQQNAQEQPTTRKVIAGSRQCARPPRGSTGSRPASLVVGIAALALILVRQLRARTLERGLVDPGVGHAGVGQDRRVLFGKQQFISFVKGHNHHLVLAVPDAGVVITAAVRTRSDA